MCIIVHRPANAKPLAREIWKECFRCHKDGAGMAYFDDNGKLIVDKGFMQFDGLYEEIKKREHLEMTVHFRTASPGMAVNPENTHPFKFQGKMVKTKAGKPRYTFAVVHNGRLPWHSTQKQSDTSCFTEDMLEPLLNQNPFMFDNLSGRTLMEMAITTATCTNKLVVMRHDAETNEGKSYIINAKAGEYAHGCWFSNHSWQLPTHSFHGFGAGVMAGLRGRGDFFGHGEEDYGDLNDQKWLKIDEHGWSWSFKFDCWVNFAAKKWTTYLPYRRAPYMPHQVGNPPAQRPTGWQQVYINTPPTTPTTPAIVDSKGVPALTAGDKAEQNKPGDVIDIKNGAADADGEEINEHTEFDDGQGVPDLEHLSDEEKQLLCREAVKYLRDMGTHKKEIRKMSTAEKIDWLRDGIKSLCVEVEDLNHIDLDMWMVALIKDGNLDKKLLVAAEQDKKKEQQHQQAEQQQVGNN